MRGPSVRYVLMLLLFVATSPAAGEVSIEESAKTFGTRAFGRGMLLSPDGHRVSMLIQHASDVPIATVLDFRTGKNKLILASEKERGLDIRWCGWKNDSRLLCGFFGLTRFRQKNVSVSRLVDQSKSKCSLPAGGSRSKRISPIQGGRCKEKECRKHSVKNNRRKSRRTGCLV